MATALGPVSLDSVSVVLDWTLRVLLAIGIPAFILNEWGKRRDLRVQFFTQDKKRVYVSILLTLRRIKRVLADMQRIGTIIYSKDDFNKKLIELQIALSTAGVRLPKEFDLESPLRATDSESRAALVLELWNSFSPSLSELSDRLRDHLEEAAIYVDDEDIMMEVADINASLTDVFFRPEPDEQAASEIQGRLNVLRGMIVNDIKADFRLRERFSFWSFVAAQGRGKR